MGTQVVRSWRRRICAAAAFALAAASIEIPFAAFAQRGGGQTPTRPSPRLIPEARPDSAVAEVGRAVRIEVLDNDIGAPPADRPAPEMRIEGQPQCGRVQLDGRALVYEGTANCVGVDIHFAYSAKLEDEWVTGVVTVNVQPAAPVQPPATTPPTSAQPPTRPQPPVSACNVPNAGWTAIRIEGGTFEKARAPASVGDFADLIDEASFTVTPFCLTLEPVQSALVTRYLNNLPEEERGEFPELSQQSTAAPGQDLTASAPARVSQRVALGFAKKFSERSGRSLELPTLQQYVAAAWERQAKFPDNRETDILLVTLRSGNLQWTSTQCSPESYWTIGPGAQGHLVKLCYERSRLDRTGFRLAIK